MSDDMEQKTREAIGELTAEMHKRLEDRASMGMTHAQYTQTAVAVMFEVVAERLIELEK